MEVRPSRSRMDGQTDRHYEAFLNFANLPKNDREAHYAGSTVTAVDCV